MAIIGNEQDNVIEGTDQADEIYGRQGNDTLYGRQGNDTLYGRQGDDTLYGNRGADTLHGNRGNDSLFGGRGADTLFGGLGADLLVGGRGADILNGGGGADTFVLGVTVEDVEGGASSFSEWLAANGKSALQDGVTTQGEFASNYTGWLESLVEEFGIGADTDGDGEIEVDIQQNSADQAPSIEGVSAEDLAAWFGDKESLVVKTGKTTHERWFVDSFELPDRTEVVGTSGLDVVQDFNAAEGDKVQLNGITAEQFAELFTVEQVDVGADGGMDTVVTMNGADGWSVTLAGVAEFDASVSVQLA